MSSLKVADGEVLKMQLEVQDNDLVTGPKSGFSDTILVEVQSYEKEHAQIESELREFRKDLLDVLAEQTRAKLTDDELKSPDKLKAAMPDKLNRQRQANQKAAAAEKKREKILAKMERDPLSDFAVWNEHKSIDETLKSLQSGDMSRAENQLAENKPAEAAESQENALTELERLSTLSEDIYEYTKMKDLTHAADRLVQKAMHWKKLAEENRVTNELVKMLRDTLQEASDILNEIQKQLRDMPQDLPDEFVNKPAVKEMKFNEITSNLEKLAQSLQAGDLRAAIKPRRNAEASQSRARHSF